MKPVLFNPRVNVLNLDSVLTDYKKILNMEAHFHIPGNPGLNSEFRGQGNGSVYKVLVVQGFVYIPSLCMKSSQVWRPAHNERRGPRSNQASYTDSVSNPQVLQGPDLSK